MRVRMVVRGVWLLAVVTSGCGDEEPIVEPPVSIAYGVVTDSVSTNPLECVKVMRRGLTTLPDGTREYQYFLIGKTDINGEYRVVLGPEPVVSNPWKYALVGYRDKDLILPDNAVKEGAHTYRANVVLAPE